MRSFHFSLVALGMLLLLLVAACGDDAPSTVTPVPPLALILAPTNTSTLAPPPVVASPTLGQAQDKAANSTATAPPTATLAQAQDEAAFPTATLRQAQDEAATPTASPLAIWIGPGVPHSLAQSITGSLPPGRYVLSADPSAADVQVETVLTGGASLEGQMLVTWVYALVAPFFSTDDGVAWDDVRNAWAGAPSGPWVGRPLLMSAETLAALQGLLGEPVAGAVVTVPAEELLERAKELAAWAIVPFEALEPRYKVLRLDGLSPLDQELDLDAYPLVTRFAISGPGEALLSAASWPSTNRDESKLTVVVMTGVTALTRATAWRMEGKGLTYPAQDVGDWLREGDITHVSNEVSFDPGCGPPDPVQVGVSFCSDPRYIELLEHISVDVVEMTGNHIADAGVEFIDLTLDMYVERGWQYFGGGRNLADARQPAVFEHNGNTIAFLGCNPAGPPSVWATDESAGAAPCDDYATLYAQLAELRALGALPIVTLQYWEEDRYDPTPQQRSDFAALIEAGAVIVSGSHAHHAQGFSFHAGGLIHYGVGNLFFDQMEIMGNRQEFIDRHVFYAGRHISTELLTALLEDWARPRPMTAQERLELLQTVFAVSYWE